jgi:hypothetical protein
LGKRALRRASGPRGDVVDALLAATYEHEPLSDAVLQGAIVNITVEGNIVYRLATDQYRPAISPGPKSLRIQFHGR